MTKEKSLEKLRSETVLKALDHVSSEGWTTSALQKALQSLGHDPALFRAFFPRGVEQAIEIFSNHIDEKMKQRLESSDFDSLKIRERISLAVKTRLEILDPYRSVALKTQSYFVPLTHKKLALKTVYRTVDTIWRLAGDTSTDFNFYTKRGLLSWVYTSSLLFWLNDTSEGYEDTHEFIDRRINEVLKIPRIKQKLKEFSFFGFRKQKS